MLGLSNSCTITGQPHCSLQRCESRDGSGAASLKSSGGYTQLDVPTPGLYSRERRNSKQNFYNKYHTASSSLCDIQWFVKGMKRTSKRMKCIKALEQTTKKIFSQSSPPMAQLRFFQNLAQDCATSPTMTIRVWGKKKLCSENISQD